MCTFDLCTFGIDPAEDGLGLLSSFGVPLFSNLDVNFDFLHQLHLKDGDMKKKMFFETVETGKS